MRHAISGQIARGLFGEVASGVGPAVEGRQPEPTASVAGCGQGWNGSGIGGEDRRHGSADLARLGPSLQRLGSTGPDRQLDGGPSLACRRSNGSSSRRSSRLVRIVRRTGPARAADRPQVGHRREVRRRVPRTLCREAAAEFGFSHMSARPRHPAQDERIVEAFKKISRAR